MKSLGIVGSYNLSTIGDLRKLIEKYPDDTSFGFRNQPVQELTESKSDEGQTFVSFQELSINYEYEMHLLSDDFIKMDAWIPIATDIIESKGKIEKYLKSGLIRKLK